MFLDMHQKTHTHTGWMDRFLFSLSFQLAQDEGSPVRGFGVVEYESAEQAEAVLTEMDRTLVGGQEVRLSLCTPGTSGRSTLAALIAAQGMVSSRLWSQPSCSPRGCSGGSCRRRLLFSGLGVFFLFTPSGPLGLLTGFAGLELTTLLFVISFPLSQTLQPPSGAGVCFPPLFRALLLSSALLSSS